MSFTEFNKSTVTIVFVGDIMLHPDNLKYELNDNNLKFDMFDEVKHIFKKADAVIGNLETTFSDFKKLPEDRQWKFIAPDEFATALKKAGFTHLAVCNNHMFDGEYSGFERTKQVIKNAGIKPLLGLSYFPVKGQVVELLNFTTHLNPSGIPADAREKYKNYNLLSSEESNIKIAFPHWGGQYNPEPNKEQVKISNFLGDKDYNIVGSGPHTPHNIIYNGDKVVAHSLGDFLSAHQKPGSTDKGKILSITFSNGKIKKYEEYNIGTVTTKGKSVVKIFS